MSHRYASVLALMILLAWPPSATAYSPIEVVAVEPAEPTTLDLVTLVIESVNEPEYRAHVQKVGQRVHVWLVPVCGPFGCPIVDEQVLRVPLGRLPAVGQWQVEVWDPLAIGVYDYLEIPVRPGVAPPPASRFELEVQPAEPDSAGHTALLIAAETCSPVSFGPPSRVGSTFVIRAAMAEEGCAADAELELGGARVELGQLEAGAYVAQLRATGSESILAETAFTVAGGVDSVDLLGRYRVGLTWETRDGQTGTAHPVALRSSESALFSFFNLANWEVLVKVLDGCALNGHRWVFLAAATDVEFTLTVEDLEGEEPDYVYTSPAGLFTPPLADTAAFACTL